MIFEIDLRILRALRMLRLLKFSRYFKVMNLLLGVLKEERQSFLAAMFLLTIAMLIASTGILGDRQKDFSDKFIQSTDSEFLDNFMTKFIGSN